MLEILGKKYIAPKEAAQRYGYSVSWFEKRRLNAKDPKFIRIKKGYKVLYPVDETDAWFKKLISMDE